MKLRGLLSKLCRCLVIMYKTSSQEIKVHKTLYKPLFGGVIFVLVGNMYVMLAKREVESESKD